MQNLKNPALMHQLKDAARNGKISRREFIYHATVAGFTVTVASGLWSITAKSEPKSGGTFRWGLHDGHESDSLDPRRIRTHATINLFLTFQGYLTMINGDGTLGPDLAVSWESNEDATQWVFSLATNAHFHSGRRVFAKDVVASLNFHRSPETGSFTNTILQDVIKISTEGDFTVIFELSQSNSSFPWLLTKYNFPICPANNDGSIDWESGDGCGPFKIEESQFGKQFSLSRHEGWHQNGPHFDKVNIIIINDHNVRRDALIEGDIDANSLIEPEHFTSFQQNQKFEIHKIPSSGAITFSMHCDTPPFNDVDVRNALKFAINRNEIIDKITFGSKIKGNDFHHSPALPFWPSEIPQREYDPEQANSLINKAGFEELSIDLSVAEFIYPNAVEICNMYAEHAKEAGINIKVINEPKEDYYSDVQAKKPFSMLSWRVYTTPDEIYTLAYKSKSPWNVSRWENKHFDELLHQSKSELNYERRKEIYHKMAILARDDGGTIIPFFNNFIYANSINIGTPENLAPNLENDGARAASRWWRK